MIRFWLPLILLAVLACTLLAYAREQIREDAEWQSVMDKIKAEVPRRVR